MSTVEPYHEGLLACVGCGCTYPIADGVPLLVPDLGGLMRSDGLAVAEAVPPDVAARLARDVPDGEPWARLLEFISTWMTAHYGDWVLPTPGGTLPFGFQPFADRLAALSPVRTAVDLGCGFGRGTLALAARADHVIGLDLSTAAVRRARRMALGEPVSYAVRQAGRHYTTRTAVPPAAVQNVRFIVGDALDPPLIPGAFERVVAINLLDNVRSPAVLLSVMDGLCAPGGELVLSSPFAWSSDIVDDDERLGTIDPLGALVERLEAGTGLGAPYVIEDQAEVPWTLRRDARSTVSYSVAWLRARKAAARQG